MITVRYDRPGWEVRVTGHALSGPKGRDVVCAGVSTLVYTLAADVEALAKEGAAEQVKIVLRPGSALIRCKPRDESRVRTVFDAVYMGFTLLSKSCGDYVKVAP